MSDLKQRLDGIADTFVPLPDALERTERRMRRRERRRRAGAILLALVVATSGIGLLVRSFGGGGATPAQPVRLPANGELWVRVGGGDGPSFVYRVDPASGVSTPLFNDGRVPRGSSAGEVNPSAVGEQYDWAPDGQLVAFSGWSTDTAGPVLYTMAPDGTKRIEVTDAGSFDAYPSWSPDGARIAYAQGTGVTTLPPRDTYVPGCEVGPGLCLSQIHVVNVDGSGDVQLTHAAVSASMPDWSPDGSEIAYVSAVDVSHTRIAFMNADGSGTTFLTDGGSEDLAPRWSPDGSKIAFLSDRTGRSQLYVMNADGTDLKQLTHFTATTVGDAVWSPDGTELAVSTGGDDFLYVLGTDGSVLRRIEPATGYGVGDLAWRPAPGAGRSSSTAAPPATYANASDLAAAIHDAGLGCGRLGVFFGILQPGVDVRSCAVRVEDVWLWVYQTPESVQRFQAAPEPKAWAGVWNVRGPNWLVATPSGAAARAIHAAIGGALVGGSGPRPSVTPTCDADQLLLAIGTQGTSATAIIGLSVLNDGVTCEIPRALGRVMVTIEQAGRPATVVGNPLTLPVSGRIGGGEPLQVVAYWSNWCRERRDVRLVVAFNGSEARTRFSYTPVCLSPGSPSRLVPVH